MSTKKQLSVVLAAAAAVLALSSRAQNQARPIEPDVVTITDEQVGDALTETRVRTALLDKLGGDAMSVHVRAMGSKVVLGGEVQKKSTAELAKEVALSVEGVKDVDDEVKVVASKSGGPFTKMKKELKDAGVESLVKNRILANTGRNGFRVEIEAVDGVVSLRGSVPPESLDAVIRTAQETKGVKRVVNLLNQKAER